MSERPLDPVHGRELWKQMWRIRRLEERSAEAYSNGKIHGFLHLYIGEEAIAVGAMGALGAEDAVVSTYREHGHALARGMSMGAILSEMYGKANGCSRGRGGSMHLFDASLRFYGGHGIVAGGIPIAVGLALADKALARPGVTACFFGDGAVDEGEFHESLNLAALWELPVLFLCENNLYAMGTAIERHLAEPDLRRRASSYGLPAETVDGMDVIAVERAVRFATETIRETGKPRFLALETYRFRAHSMFDAELYRDKDEVKAWRERDPIATFAARLEREGALDAAARETIEREVESELEAAVREAEEGELEPLEALDRDIVSREIIR